MTVQPYLFFEGKCEEAARFYEKAIGAQVTAMMRFKDGPPESCPAGAGDKIMHMTFNIGHDAIMASDGHCSGKTEFKGFALSLTAKTEADARRFFAALSEGGQVGMPMEKTFFSPAFGMVADKFGVLWMVIVM